MLLVKEKGSVLGEVKKEVRGKRKVEGWVKVVGLIDCKRKKVVEKRMKFVEKEMKEMEEELRWLGEIE